MEKYYLINQKNSVQTQNYKVEEIYLKKDEGFVECLLLTEKSLSPEYIEIKEIEIAEYLKKITDYIRAGNYEIKNIDKAVYEHRRQGLENK